MHVMILAAGLGTRLRPLTDVCPKPLVPFMLRPMLAHLLTQVRQCGARTVVINLHYQADRLRQWLGDGRQWGLQLHVSYEPEILGTAGAIKRVASRLCQAPFLVINADVIMDLDLAAVWQWHCQRDAAVTMVVRPDPAAWQYGAVVVDAADRVCQINGRPHTPSRLDGEATIFTGVQVVSPRVLEQIPAERFVSTTAETYPALLAQGAPVYGYRYRGYWIDVGVPERYRQAHWDMLDGLCGTGWITHVPAETRIIRPGHDPCPEPDGVAVVPPVVLGPGTTLAATARIGPYAVLGAGCCVEAGAQVRESVLWDRVRIGAGARVGRCVLGSDVHVEPDDVLWDVMRRA
jgi:mannose-1-phosphate guanylyltransferase